MKQGDRVVITKTLEAYPYFCVGDTATLTQKDDGGDWWADFDAREWNDHDREFCLQDGITEFELLNA